MASPTARSLAYLRKEGWSAYVVEKFNSFTKRRTDVAGFGDLLAWSPYTCQTALVQVTSTGNLASRRKKILIECNAEAQTWMEAGFGSVGTYYNIIILHGWAKRGAKGKRKLWTCKEDLVTYEELLEYQGEAAEFQRTKAIEDAKKKQERAKKRKAK